MVIAFLMHRGRMATLQAAGSIRSEVRHPDQIGRPYHTRDYCQRKGLKHRITAEAAADLIRQLPLPEETKVIVVGETAYGADAVRKGRD